MMSYGCKYIALVPPCILTSDQQSVRSNGNYWGHPFVKKFRQYNMTCVSWICPEYSFNEFQPNLCCGKHSIHFYQALDGYNEHCEQLAEKFIQNVLDMGIVGNCSIFLFGVAYSPSCANSYIFSRKGVLKQPGIFLNILKTKLEIQEIKTKQIGINRRYPKKALTQLTQFLEEKDPDKQP